MTLERLHNILAVTDDGYWEWNIQTGAVYFSPAWKAMLGYTDDEIENSFAVWEELLHPEDAFAKTEAAKLASDPYYKYNVEFRLRCKDGHYKWILARAKTIQNDLSGVPTVIAGTHLDIDQSHQHLETIKKMQRQYETMFDEHSSIMLLFKPDTGQIVNANKSAENFYGYSHEEFLNMSIDDINMLPNEEIAKLRVETVAKKKNHFIFPHRLKSGEIRTIEVYGTPIETEHGVLIYSIIRDVTEAERNKSEMIELNQKLNNLAQNAPGMVYTFQYYPDGRSRIPYASKHIYDLVGLTPEEVFDDASKVFERIHPEDAEHMQKSIIHSFETLIPWQDEFRVDHPSKGLIWLKGISNPQQQEDGSVLWQGYIYDITESVVTKQKLLEVNKALKFSQSLAKIAAWKIVLGVDEVIASEEYRELYGVEEGPCTFNRIVNEVVHPDDREKLVQVLTEVFESPHEGSTQYRIVVKNEIKYLNVTWELEYDREGNVLAFVGYSQDVTKHVEQETLIKLQKEEFEKQQIEKNNFLLSLIETAPIRIFWKDRNLNYLGCNMVFALDAGLNSSSEIVGKTDYDLCWRDQVDLYRADDKEVMDTGISKLSFEEPQTTTSGEIIWLSTSKVPIKNAQDEIIGMLGMYDEITTKKNIELQLRENSEVFQGIIETTLDSFFILDKYGNFIDVNSTYCKNSGYSRKELLKMNVSQLDPFVTREEITRMIQYVIEQKHHQFEAKHQRKDGSIWDVETSVTYLDIAGGKLYAFMRDITDRKRLEEKLLESENFLLQSQNNAGIGSYSLDTIDMTWKSSEALDRLFGIESDYERTLESWIKLIYPEDQSTMGAYFMDKVMGEYQMFNREYRIVRQNDHEIRWVHGLGKLEFDNAGVPIKMSGTIQDVTERKEHEKQLLQIAHYDVLTGLPNRVLNADRLHQAMIQTKRRKTKLAVLYLDLDGFKNVNDHYGHSVGDKLLLSISSKLKQALREGDTLSRLGGDEFVAILSDINDPNDAKIIIQRLLDAANEAISFDDFIIQISVSIGVTFYPQQDDVEADQLIRQADQAMYEAKQSGKNHYHVFDFEYDRIMRARHESIDRLKLALDRREFVLYYQPKVNMRNGALIGAEALIRWQHPEDGLLPPAAFLPAIENHSLEIDVGEWVIEEAITQIQRWKQEGLVLTVSVNVGARQLLSRDFMERLETILARHNDLNPSLLQIEILETTAIEDLNQVSSVIHRCKQKGISFALDDFGTGYSSLTYLKQLPIETLKIDQTFVRDMLIDPDDLAILEGVIGLAKAFQREIIAEGVETYEHGRELMWLGCELAQGYGISKPMEAVKMVEWSNEWLKEHKWLV